MELWKSTLKIEFDFSSSDRPSAGSFAGCSAKKVVFSFYGALGLPDMIVARWLLDSTSFCGEDKALEGADGLSFLALAWCYICI